MPLPRLPKRTPGTDPLSVKPPLLLRVVSAALLLYGLLNLRTDLSRPKGECCTPLYYNHDAAIWFSAAWCLLAAVGAALSTQTVRYEAGTLRVSWLWGLVDRRRPVERLNVRKVELTARGGQKTGALRLGLGRLRVYVTPDMDGYARLSRSLLGPPGPDAPEADRD